jgi:DNA-binding transcriptional ArsR family regulator
MSDHPRPDPRPDHVRLDSAKLQALAHPLRMRLLAALRLQGPATATELARRLDTNSGQTSYHLRKLAEVDLIEDDPDRSTGRDRSWRASHWVTSWSSMDFRDDPDDRAADALLVGQVARLHGRWIDEALAARDGWDEAWLGAADMSDWALHLTPTTLRAMVDEITDVVRRYRAHEEIDDPGAERVTVMLHAFPHPEPSV